MNSTLYAGVRSDRQPQPGQRNRASGNFTTQEEPFGTKRLRWVIQGAGDIKFNVMEDKSGSEDPTVFKDITNGAETEFKSSRNYYIANPEGAVGHFFVEVIAVG